MMERNNYRLPAEWERQDFMQLTWPHENTDWAPILDRITEVYLNMAREIARRERLLIVTQKSADSLRAMLSEHLGDAEMERITFFECDTNGTWARDHGFITLVSDGGKRLLDYCFSGWGMKFAAEKDNAINTKLKEMLSGDYADRLDFVLEGGSIESDDNGTVMTTSNCLLSPNRNGQMSKEEIEAYLKEQFGAKQVLWVDYGELQGDDTDSHIDTLARFAPNNTIVCTRCQDSGDDHFEELEKMCEQIATFTNANGSPYKVVTLPLPKPIYDEDNQRLPATYANFLITNNYVLMPTYAQPELDALAMNNLQEAFPKHKVIGIDCNALIKQHGSLHCITMQLLENTINTTL